ncbi:3-phenylpropionate-dihydrodiol/cinnamic acid-dihydrodiol dehydrogenase [Leucobacter sp. BZR 635]
MTTTQRLDSLRAQRAVVLGGTGSVGEHFVRGYLAAGAEVIVPSRTAEKAAMLLGDATFAGPVRAPVARVGDYTSFAGARDTADAIVAEHGEVDHVVVALGSWWSGAPLWNVDEDTFEHFFTDVTSAYIASARAWLPILPAHGSLQLVLGASGIVPVPGASIISMAQASLVMMRRVLAEEAGARRRIFSIVLGNLNLRRRGWSREDFVDADDAVRVSLGLAAGSQPSADVVLRKPDQARAAIREFTQ